MGPKRNKLSFATQIPNATSVPVSDFGAGTRIFVYLRVPTNIMVVRVPKPFFMPHHTTKVMWDLQFSAKDDVMVPCYKICGTIVMIRNYD